tara:strand:+ start:95 stop:319 length:225 start_codon:yes stop_codon:yes gene_type:complete
MENVYEHFFFLKHYGGWSFVEAYNLPIGLRNWFVGRLTEHLQMENDIRAKSNSGNVRELSSANQPAPPAGLKIK